MKKYGGTDFKVPPGGYFIKIDRYSGAQLPDDASGPNAQAEYFREGETPVFGLGALVDGGFGMGADLPLFAPGESDSFDGAGAFNDTESVTTGDGSVKSVPKKATFGSASSGGLY